MCRLLGVVSRRHDILTDHLGEDLPPFVELSSIHCDGWGLAAWDTDDNLVVHRQPGAAHLEPRMTAITEGLAADSALFHLRRASEGMEVSERNTHPFAAGSAAFAHNGYFGPAHEIDKTLAELGAPPAVGDTDSERYFGLVNALMSHDGPVDAILRAAQIITSTASELVALNALMLTHEGLYAYSQYAPQEQGESAESGGASYELRYRIAGDSVIVASTGWEVEDAQWETLPQGSVLEVRRHDLALSVHRPLDHAV